MNVLFVGPHPDDVELSCLGTWLRHKERHDTIIYLICSDCEELPENKSLEEESAVILQITDPDQLHKLHLPNTRLYSITNRETIRHYLESLREHGLDRVYATWDKDINQDHMAVAEEAQRVFRYHTLYQYENTNSAIEFHPNYYVELTPEQFRLKMDILDMFKSQRVRRIKNIASKMARFRGEQIRRKFAEGYIIWRMIDTSSQ